MKVAIIGGHLSPALSIIESLPKTWKVIFIGRKYNFEGEKTLSLEFESIRKLNIEFENLSTGRFQRKFTRNTIPSIVKIPYGFMDAFKILNKHKPDAVLGFGGYIQLPLVMAAFFRRIPIVIHEQTLEAGLSNQISSKFANKICISWESSRKFFPKNKTVLTGLPVRNASLKKLLTIRPRNEIKKIFVTGGSSGSHFINALIGDCLADLLSKFEVIHQTGDSKLFNDFDRLTFIRSKLSKKLKPRYLLKKFLDPDDFSNIIQNCDLVVARAGINTIAEILISEKSSILIPLPFAQRNEQLKNARFLEKLGIGEIIEQKNATTNLLIQKIEKILQSESKLSKERNYLNLFENASSNIIDTIKECAGEK